ncbi:hypothetical protein GGQ84_003044 [Desulfitispora alkaliphila]|uniref:hypothetical protein n=1 Tax=Desulfitispora alkaliphila TaxID=622674 RepID=UPI003D23B8A1
MLVNTLCKIDKVLEYTRKCQQLSIEDLDYRFFTDSLKELTEAECVVLSLLW